MSESSEKSTVFIVDDDAAIRQAMQLLFRSVNLPAESFASADEFLARVDPDRAGCLVLDIRMPGIGGMDLQERLLQLGSTLPIIFMTGHADVPMAVKAMHKGAFDFIQKPFRDQDILECVAAALASDEQQRVSGNERAEIVAREQSLTKREREVMELVVMGKPNKIIAHELGTSQRTIEIHRARVMEKMGAASLADLVRMSLAIRVAPHS